MVHKWLLIMIDIVIIGQNESKHIDNMYMALCKYPYKRIWILDRCTDNSSEKLDYYLEDYIKTPQYLKGRQTSFSRNLGLANTRNDVLFIDGDRYPTVGSLSNLETTKEDISLLLLEEDHRDNIDMDKAYGTVHNGFYSCGLFMKREAINRVLEFQQGELFKLNLQEFWGVEDVSLGDVCYHLGLTCGIYRDCRLRGKFDKLAVDSIKTIEKRFTFREKLNVLWN